MFHYTITQRLTAPGSPGARPAFPRTGIGPGTSVPGTTRSSKRRSGAVRAAPASVVATRGLATSVVVTSVVSMATNRLGPGPGHESGQRGAMLHGMTARQRPRSQAQPPPASRRCHPAGSARWSTPRRRRPSFGTPLIRTITAANRKLLPHLRPTRSDHVGCNRSRCRRGPPNGRCAAVAGSSRTPTGVRLGSALLSPREMTANAPIASSCDVGSAMAGKRRVGLRCGSMR